MKIALVCDDLIQRGGQERVMEAVAEIWPEADIYTSVASEYWIERFKRIGRNIHTSFMQSFPFVLRLNRVYSAFALHTLAMEAFDFTDYDVVITISSRYAHQVNTRPEQVHICYMNSPGRMFWEPRHYFNNGFLERLSYRLISPYLMYARVNDFVAANRIDHIIANSNNSRNKVLKFLRKQAVVIYPFIDLEKIPNEIAVAPDRNRYCTVVTRLSSWKRVDIAIEACIRGNLKLKIIGEGSDMPRLRKIANENGNIELLGYVPDDEKYKILANSSCLINTQFEDFGIVPLEAMACGVPVVAYGKGGATETVIENKTGLFFDTQTPESLLDALKTLEKTNFSKTDCVERAREFSKEVFKTKIKQFVLEKSNAAI